MLSAGQTHYLRAVMRARVGDDLALFNGRDGEWRAKLATLDRKGAEATPAALVRAQTAGGGPELVVALVKRDRLETVIEKATELGAARVRLAITRFAQPERANLTRLAAIAAEAAEQTGRLDVPEIVAPVRLDTILADWPGNRPLIFCDEAGDAETILDALCALPVGQISILIGPEGGFAAEERSQIRANSAVIPVSLGPRILRADTAAIAALSLWQAAKGDWRP